MNWEAGPHLSWVLYFLDSSTKRNGFLLFLPIFFFYFYDYPELDPSWVREKGPLTLQSQGMLLRVLACSCGSSFVLMVLLNGLL